jgi:hypothetical protein
LELGPVTDTADHLAVRVIRSIAKLRLRCRVGD